MRRVYLLLLIILCSCRESLLRPFAYHRSVDRMLSEDFRAAVQPILDNVVRANGRHERAYDSHFEDPDENPRAVAEDEDDDDEEEEEEKPYTTPRIVPRPMRKSQIIMIAVSVCITVLLLVTIIVLLVVCFAKQHQRQKIIAWVRLQRAKTRAKKAAKKKGKKGAKAAAVPDVSQLHISDIGITEVGGGSQVRETSVVADLKSESKSKSKSKPKSKAATSKSKTTISKKQSTMKKSKK